MALALKTILEICTKHGYLNSLIKPNNVNTKIDTKELFRVGPTGLLLLENLKEEWRNNMFNINNQQASFSVFYNSGIFQETFRFVKELCGETLPFGITEIIDEKHNVLKYELPVNNVNKEESDEKIDFKQLLPYNREQLLCTMFVSPVDSTEFFLQWQKTRRIWWRKFSASPARYSLNVINTNANTGRESVGIFAKYNWGEQLVESLNLFTEKDSHPSLTIEDSLFDKDKGKKNVKSHFLVSQINVSTLLLNTLCDSFDEESIVKNKTRQLLRLNRKIAPYKISFAISSLTKRQDLKDLAQHICNLLRAKNISCLYLPSSYNKILTVQWLHYDQLGVPYTITLNEDTLNNGIVKLRSRETTLFEQIHVSKLVPYVEQLFQNY